MGFNNIKAKQAQRGFTIVELLIVIVVIGILAAITLVSYNGITTRANGASAKAAAATVQKKLELYQADAGTGRYPDAANQLTNAPADKSYFLASNNPTWTFGTTQTVTANNGTTTVMLRKCAAGTPASQSAITTTITGIEIYYWDYTATTPAVAMLTVGSNTDSTTTCPAS